MTGSRRLVAVVSALALAAGAVAGCGDDDSDDGEATATAQEAIAEIGAVREGLDEALAAYRAGDEAEAERAVEDAYLEHFEIVEGPLEEADEELNEELEDSIREELTATIAEGVPEDQVATDIAEIERGLDEAEDVLRAE